MQIFKLFFKVFRKYRGQIFMYIGIFAGMLFGFILPNATQNGTATYVEASINFAVFDYDNSKISVAIADYLAKYNTRVELKDDAKETMQDELYARNVDGILVFKAGYSEKLDNEHLELIVIPGTNTANYIKTQLADYILAYSAYLEAGLSVDEAIAKANTVMEKKITVSMNEEDRNSNGAVYYFFVYLGWIFVAMTIVSIAPVINVLTEKKLRDRIECSSYKTSKSSREILLAVFVVGLMICAVFFAIAGVLFNTELFNIKGLLYVINAICFMLVALALTFLVSKISRNDEVISVFSNILSLGMAFLCGIFVPRELMSEGVNRVAMCLPAHWYVRAIDYINNFKLDKLGKLVGCMAVQLMFAVVIVVVALFISRRKFSKKSRV